jgi:hypothetical protein
LLSARPDINADEDICCYQRLHSLTGRECNRDLTTVVDQHGGYDVTVPFWCSTILRYVIATLVSAFVSILVVFCLLAFVIAPKDDSPALGIAWFMFSVLLACVLIPLGPGVTGEMIECGVQGRRFRGLGAFIRSLLAIPIMVGPIYCLYEVFLRRPDARDSLWAVKLTVLSLLSDFLQFARCGSEELRRCPTHNCCKHAMFRQLTSCQIYSDPGRLFG